MPKYENRYESKGSLSKQKMTSRRITKLTKNQHN